MYSMKLLIYMFITSMLLCTYLYNDNNRYKKIKVLYIYPSDHGLSVLKMKKTSDIAVIVGTGTSLNDLTHHQINILSSHTDIWGMNQLFFHKYIVPKFYHIEMKRLDGHSTSSLWNFFNAYRRTAYKNTTFITGRSLHDVYNTLSKSMPYPENICTYSVSSIFDDHIGCTPTRLNKIQRYVYKSNKYIENYCSASITRILHFIVRLQYKHVAFIGVELNSPRHFYSSNMRLMKYIGGFEHSIYKKNVKEYNSTVHPTGARGVQLFINMVAQIYNNTLFYNLANTSLLSYSSHIVTINVYTFIHSVMPLR